ncbi:MAG: nucleotide exchange factor GrpE [Ruminococcus sp.]|nr:nucleotide exchange factor GrpE [Ruminococcus sp.]
MEENKEKKDLEETVDEPKEESKEESKTEPDKEEAAAECLTEEEKLKAELAEQKDKYLRVMAEYDNFRKRTAKERLELISTAKADAVTQILPVIDNFERALSAQTQDETYKAGIEMIFKQFGDVLKNLGIEEINPLGEKFDPNVANAVNQIEDENLGENEVAQVFQKGYRIGDKVLRYAMVVVANP